MNYKNSNIVFIFAHYDQNGYLAKHILEHIQYIFNFGKQIIFVSTHLKTEYKKILSPYAKVIIRENTGYDFWSYKLGLEFIEEIDEVEHIIMQNSSFVCLDPKRLYQLFFKGVGAEGMYGLSSNKAPFFHIQSYFFSFYGKSIIQSSAFKDWWQQMVPLNNRQEIIKEYEIGMSSWFVKQGVSLFSTTSISMKDTLQIITNYINSIQINLNLLKKIWSKRKFFHIKVLNITHFGWQILFRKYSILKLELLLHNPTHQKIYQLKHMINGPQKRLLKDAMGKKFYQIFNP